MIKVATDAQPVVGRRVPSRTTVLLLSFGVAVAAGLMSIARIVTAGQGSMSELVWAEDGLFPLCVRKVGLLECLGDPFAGYLLGVPRLLAAITANTPIYSWGLAANVIAAISWGALSGISTYWLATAGVRPLAAVTVAVIPVVIPITGLEAVNSIGSIYMPLLFSATLALALGWSKRSQTVIAAGLVVLAAVTIPTALVLIGVLLVSLVRRRVTQRSGVIVLTALAVGGALQIAVIFSSPTRRNMGVSAESIGFWLDDLPRALLTVWPGMHFGESAVFGIFTLPVVPWTGLFVAGGLVILSLFVMSRKSTLSTVAGLLILAGLSYSFIPTATGYASNRYFVLTVAAVVAAALLILEEATANTRHWLFLVVVVVLAGAWVTAFPSSAWRATPAPPWSEGLDRVKTECLANPMNPAQLTFSPDWPQQGVTELQPPTNQFAPCSALRLAPGE